MDDLIIKLLFTIKANPGLYLGKKSLRNLDMFLSGYILRQREIDNSFRTSFEYFGNYVNNYYKAGAKAAGWQHIIDKQIKNEAEAFDTFYLLLDEYIEKIKNNASTSKKKDDRPTSPFD